MDPKPSTAKDGVPWCSEECPAFTLGLVARHGHGYCDLLHTKVFADECCLPAVRSLAASEKRHREALGIARGHLISIWQMGADVDHPMTPLEIAKSAQDMARKGVAAAEAAMKEVPR